MAEDAENDLSIALLTEIRDLQREELAALQQLLVKLGHTLAAQQASVKRQKDQRRTLVLASEP